MLIYQFLYESKHVWLSRFGTESLEQCEALQHAYRLSERGHCQGLNVVVRDLLCRQDIASKRYLFLISGRMKS